MYLLDTNAISEPKRARPNAGVVAWLNDQLLTDLHLSVITIGELRRGIIRLEPGRRRDDLDYWLAQVVLRFGDRILPIDLEVTDRWAALAEAQRAAGRTADMSDELIAATAHVHGLSVVTRNVRHFEHSGCRVVSPWSA
jgi:predicted nucleic acid-binding protein